MFDRTLEQLNDIEDIKQLKARYCRLIDQKRWDELEADFVPTATIEIAGAPGVRMIRRISLPPMTSWRACGN